MAAPPVSLVLEGMVQNVDHAIQRLAEAVRQTEGKGAVWVPDDFPPTGGHDVEYEQTSLWIEVEVFDAERRVEAINRVLGLVKEIDPDRELVKGGDIRKRVV
jgi:hypothetical protein